MEQRIQFKTTTRFIPASEELKRLYTLMALLHSPCNCTPEYREHTLMRRLCKDLSRYNKELHKYRETDPNNLTLSHIHNFIQRHYSLLKALVKEEINGGNGF